MLAAHRAGIRQVILPERNEKDVVDVPEEILSELQISYVRTVDEVLASALDESAAPLDAGARADRPSEAEPSAPAGE
jgi:ATP-dependent Lon protease